MSSSRSSEHWFDPRLTVFVIWGIFVILFICIPSKRFIQRLLFYCGCSCCGYDGTEDDYGNPSAPTNNNGHEVSYEIMSSARKQEMDSLRASHLAYRLYPFSLTVEKKHLLGRISDLEPPISTAASSDEKDRNKSNESKVHAGPVDTDIDVDNQSSDGSLPPQDRKPDPPLTDNIDIEKGFIRGMDPPACGEEVKEEEDDGVKYTHIAIPYPGHNFDGVDVHNEKMKDLNTVTASEKTKEEKKSRIRLFGGGKSKRGDENDTKDDPSIDGTNNKEGMNDEDSESRRRRRSCPIYCAICLMEYEPTERITWSSNPECTHVFHEDCIVQWLVSLGRTKSKRQRFAEAPNEAQLLNYILECPCCRQEFVSRKQAELPEVRVSNEHEYRG